MVLKGRWVVRRVFTSLLIALSVAALLVFGAAPAWAHSLPQVKVLQIGTGVHDVQDTQGLVTQRLDARPGTMVLVRPDQFVAWTGQAGGPAVTAEQEREVLARVAG